MQASNLHAAIGSRRSIAWRFAPAACASLLLAASAGSQEGRVSVVFDCPPDDCHVAPVTSSGGFVGQVANGGSTAPYFVTCGASGIGREAEADSRGGVSVLFSEDNGFSCPEGGQVEIKGLASGGWYWLVDYGRASAAPLVAKDTIGNFSVKPWDPGSLDIDMVPVEHGHATLVYDAVGGSLGLLPHILPQPKAPPPPPCGPVRDEDDEWVQNSTDCVLGDGGTAIALRYHNVYVRPRARAVTLRRPGSGELTVVLSLWGNGSGHISTATPVNPSFGHYVPEATALQASSWSMEVVGRPSGVAAATLSGRTLTIAADDRFCDPTATPVVNVPVTLEIAAAASPAAIPVAPPIEVDDDSVAATRQILIACAPATANRGAELAAEPPERRTRRR